MIFSTRHFYLVDPVEVSWFARLHVSTQRSASDRDGQHWTSQGTLLSLRLQISGNLRIVDHAVATVVQVVDLWCDGVALPVALADARIDLDAHGILLSWRFDGGTRLLGRSDQAPPAQGRAADGLVGSLRILGNPGALAP